MYPYSDLPPNEQPNQGNYPPPYPYNYPPNPQNQGGYPPNNYQGQPPQPGYYYYPPQQPRPNFYPFLRAFGIALLIFFFLGLFGRHGFFFWPLIVVGIVLLVNRHRWGGYGHRQHYNRWQYNHHRPYYDYNQAPQPGPGYYYPPQPGQPQTPPTGVNPGATQGTVSGWPSPTDEPKTNNPI